MTLCSRSLTLRARRPEGSKPLCGCALNSAPAVWHAFLLSDRAPGQTIPVSYQGGRRRQPTRVSVVALDSVPILAKPVGDRELLPGDQRKHLTIAAAEALTCLRQTRIAAPSEPAPRDTASSLATAATVRPSRALAAS